MFGNSNPKRNWLKMKSNHPKKGFMKKRFWHHSFSVDRTCFNACLPPSATQANLCKIAASSTVLCAKYTTLCVGNEHASPHSCNNKLMQHKQLPTCLVKPLLLRKKPTSLARYCFKSRRHYLKRLRPGHPLCPQL